MLLASRSLPKPMPKLPPKQTSQAACRQLPRRSSQPMWKALPEQSFRPSRLCCRHSTMSSPTICPCQSFLPGAPSRQWAMRSSEGSPAACRRYRMPCWRSSPLRSGSAWRATWLQRGNQRLSCTRCAAALCCPPSSVPTVLAKQPPQVMSPWRAAQPQYRSLSCARCAAACQIAACTVRHPVKHSEAHQAC